MAIPQVELFSKFSSFPDESHVRDVCRIGQGDKTCRYLQRRVAPSGNGYQCEKAGAYRKILDSDVQNKAITEHGDNCSGVLGFVDKNQRLLQGLTMLSQIQVRDDRVKRESGEFDSLIIDDGRITIGNILKVPEEDVEISVDTQGITFLKLDDPEGGELIYRKETVIFENPPK